jgi:hypothetical protein
MPSEFVTSVIVTVVNLLTTYMLHSTLLLATTALVVWCCRLQSHVLVERLWKSAAVIGLLTAPLQLICGFGNPVFSFPLTVQQQIVENSATLTASRTADGLTELQPSPVSMASASTSTSTNEDTVPIVAGTESPAPSEPPVMTDANVETVLAPSTVNVHTNDSHPISDIVPSIAAYSADEISAEVVGRPRSLPVLATGFAGAAMVIVVLGSLHFLAASRSFRRRIRRFKPMQSGPVEAALSNLIRRHRLRRPVQLLEADELGEPIAFGVGRSWFLAALNPAWIRAN